MTAELPPTVPPWSSSCSYINHQMYTLFLLLIFHCLLLCFVYMHLCLASSIVASYLVLSKIKKDFMTNFESSFLIVNLQLNTVIKHFMSRSKELSHYTVPFSSDFVFLDHFLQHALLLSPDVDSGVEHCFSLECLCTLLCLNTNQNFLIKSATSL